MPRTRANAYDSPSATYSSKVIDLNIQESEGLKIAAKRTFTEREGYWLVPRGKNRFLHYRVQIDANCQECTCDEYSNLKPRWCRHLYALKYKLEEQKKPKAPPTKQKTVQKARPKPPAKTYPRDWATYNKAREEKHAEFKVVLHSLCQCLPARTTTSKGGRPPVPLADLVYAAVTKVRQYKAGKEMESLLEEEQKEQRIKYRPKASTIFNFFNSTEATEIFHRFIAKCCVPFRLLETDFAIDSTFFPVPKKIRWYDPKKDKSKEKLLTWKAHISCGINSKIIAAIRVTPDRGEDKATADSKQFPYLLQDTAERFRVIGILADAAYCSIKNYNLAAEVGAKLFSRFTSRDKGLGGGDFTDAWFYQRDRPKDHFAKYNLRNNVESLNSVIKREFPGKLLFKNDLAIENELLCVALIHNINCLIAAKYGLGMDIEVWKTP